MAARRRIRLSWEDRLGAITERDDGRRWTRGLPAPVDIAVAGGGAPGPAAVQGRGEAVPDPHGEEPVAGPPRPRDRGGPGPAADARGGARCGHRGDRSPPGCR